MGVLSDRWTEVSFVGSTLGPLFLEDPQKGDAAELMATLADLDVDAAAREWPFVEEDAAREGLALMARGLDDGPRAEDLTWEYRRLFVGPLPKVAPPWGSVYTDKDCVVFGESCLELRSWMRRNGIGRQGTTDTPEDHIGLLLELLAWLAENKPELLEECLRLHVLPWSHHFFELMGREVRHPFYRGLALLCDASLEGMRMCADIEVTYPHFFR
ncbi:MAG: Tat proofreading chaperone DmsD [Coriobacteriia bacterium]|nr:Tat proofreading chaperone DmsD [Coriobacteriia bacterium]MBS5478959.1 Tat proofreading chaperone DmsD [Coriobacteriia bacterium]